MCLSAITYDFGCLITDFVVFGCFVSCLRLIVLLVDSVVVVFWCLVTDIDYFG